MNTRHRAITKLLVGFAARSTFLALSPPADAHFTRAYEGSNYASVGNDHRWVEVCDMEQDGNGVYGYFYVYNHAPEEVSDHNGSEAGCGNSILPDRVMSFMVCERHWTGDSCSPVKEVEW